MRWPLRRRHVRSSSRNVPNAAGHPYKWDKWRAKKEKKTFNINYNCSLYINWVCGHHKFYTVYFIFYFRAPFSTELYLPQNISLLGVLTHVAQYGPQHKSVHKRTNKEATAYPYKFNNKATKVVLAAWVSLIHPFFFRLTFFYKPRTCSTNLELHSNNLLVIF